VVATGTATEFGLIAQRLSLRPPESEFDRGLRQFGYLLTRVMLWMALLVFVAHVLLGRPAVETLLFAVALAVGLSPELLPAILSINLARAARMMAERGVLVRRLNAIENLGSMDVLCTDKTGTLTENRMSASHVMLLDEHAKPRYLSTRDMPAHKVPTTNTVYAKSQMP
jgi:Mg2+-importing ATPase